MNPNIPPTLPPRPPRSGDPNRGTAIAALSIVGVALIALIAIAVARHDRAQPEQLAFAEKPAQSRITECNQYAAQVARDSGPSGSSASVRDDDPNLVGLSDENRYSDAARVAYRDCMLGIQHES